jgi:uroporphyrin-III C-methyltransferase
MKGKVYLLELASGELELFTPEAIRLLRAAEVVLHDDQVSSEILDLIPPSTQVRNIAKLRQLPGASEDSVRSALISAAREGHQVVHLKSNGAPPFPGVGEEVEALAEAGVECEVIPLAVRSMGA